MTFKDLIRVGAIVLVLGFQNCGEFQATEQASQLDEFSEFNEELEFQSYAVAAGAKKHVFGPAGCEISDETARARGYPIHPLKVGTTDYLNPSTVGYPRAVKFVNRTKKALQINFLQPVPSATYLTSGASAKWGEICMYLDQFQQYPSLVDPRRTGPGQSIMGVGEVGCVTKLATEPVYGQLRWGTDAFPTALAVPPGSCLIVNGQQHYNFRLSVSRQSQGLVAVRQPTTDEIISCTGELQTTPWKPWKNQTSRALRLSGAYIYAATIEDKASGLSGTQTTEACLFVLSAARKVRASYCSPQYPVNARGVMQIPLVRVKPGEYVAAQAKYRCPAKYVGTGKWGGAMFMTMW